MQINPDMTNVPHIEAIKTKYGVSTGIFRCSVCNVEFALDPNKPAETVTLFVVHLTEVHGGASPNADN